MIKLSTIVAAAALSLGVAGTASAIPMLQIVDSGGAVQSTGFNLDGTPTNPNAEAIGDPGGTNYVNGPTAGATAGPGLPTILGGWPDTPSFAPDSYGYAAPGTTCTPSVDCPRGISGYDGSYLNLTEAANVTFQFMGKGDASNHDIFQLFLGGSWVTIWDNQSATNGTCGMIGTSPTCPNSGSQASYSLGAGLIAFRFQNLTNPATATNDGTNNPKDVAPGYFLGIDPYQTNIQYYGVGQAAYAGFTDLSPLVDQDHDYEDTIVRMSVPEPGTIFLLGAGLLGVGVGRRKMAARSV